MTRTMGIRLLPAVVTAVVAAIAGSAVTLEIDPKGSIEIAGTGLRLSTDVYEKDPHGGHILAKWPTPLGEGGTEDGTWRCEFFRSSGFRRSTGAPLVDGIALLKPAADGGAAFEQTLSACSGMEVARVGSFLEIPVASVTGMTWRVGEKTGVFPDVFVRGRSVLASGKVTRAELPVLPGGGVLSMRFPEPTSVVFQDARDWGQPSFSFRILASPGGYAFAKGEKRTLRVLFSAPGGVEVRVPRLRVAVAGPDWIPVDYRKNVRKGSALDLSSLLHAPAGKFGFLRAEGGHFEFEGRPGVPQRFYGANLCYSATVPTNASEVAERLARLGFNAVRIHHYENGQGVLDERTGAFVADRLDRLDQLLAECFARGIYATTDLFTSRVVTRGQLGLDGNPSEKAPFKALVVLHEPSFENWKRFARDFLLHRNPYTGRTYAEEPGIATLVLVNEGRLHMEFPPIRREAPVREAWRAWLAERRKADAAAFADVPDDCGLMRDDHPRFAVTELFAADMERRFAERAIAYLRSIGVKALVSDVNDAAYSAPFQSVRETYDYVDDHSYIAHPWFGGRAWLPPGFVSTPTPFKENDRRRPALNAFVRVAGKPFVVSEWNWCHPDPMRACGGMLVPAMAAVQDWSGLWCFAYAHHIFYLGSQANSRPFSFDIATDPLMLLANRAGVFLFLRGDLEPLGESFVLDIEREDLAPAGKRYADSRPLWCAAAWKARFATSVRPDAFPSARHLPYSSVSAACCPVALPDSPCVSIVPSNSEFRISAERFAGGCTRGGRFKAGALGADVHDGAATVWAATLDGKPFRGTRHVLVGHFTDCRIEGNVWVDVPGGFYTLNSKPGRPLARRGTADLELSLAPGKWQVRALATDGAPKAPVPCRVVDGRLSFAADTARIPADGTFLYELLKE